MKREPEEPLGAGTYRGPAKKIAYLTNGSNYISVHVMVAIVAAVLIARGSWRQRKHQHDQKQPDDTKEPSTGSGGGPGVIWKAAAFTIYIILLITCGQAKRQRRKHHHTCADGHTDAIRLSLKKKEESQQQIKRNKTKEQRQSFSRKYPKDNESPRKLQQNKGLKSCEQNIPDKIYSSKSTKNFRQNQGQKAEDHDFVTRARIDCVYAAGIARASIAARGQRVAAKKKMRRRQRKMRKNLKEKLKKAGCRG